MAADPQDPLHQTRQAMAAWERNLRPRRESRWLLWVVLAVLLDFGAWRASEWLLTQRRATPPPGPFPAVRLPTVPTPVTPHTSADADTPAAPAAESYGVTKCLSATGQAEYSDRPCPTGTQASTVWVQPNVNLADGMSLEQRQATLRENQRTAGNTRRPEESVARSVDVSRRTVCSSLDEEIKRWDEAARQPQTGQSQDWIKQRRQETRDRQFRLCR